MIRIIDIAFNRRWRTCLVAAGVATVCCLLEPPGAHAQRTREFKDVVFATVDGKPLALDLYLPAGQLPPPLVLWVHGGAWNTGTKANVPRQLIDSGLVLASVDFRQASVARFPAQVHDIKAAIRFLRANARTYGYHADTIVIAGASSGGHLAALVGVTNRHSQLEGEVGSLPGASSDVQGIISYFGASNLRSILSQSTPFGLNMRRPALERLLGGQPDQVPDLAVLASPVTHVDTGDPPLLLLHGDRDPQMPLEQSQELQRTYERLGLPVECHVLQGAAHGGDAFFAPRYLKVVTDFLGRIGAR